MDFEKRQEIEQLKFQIDQIEQKEKQLKDELERLNNEKAEILRQISEKSDERYEHDMLELVYQQRRKQ